MDDLLEKMNELIDVSFTNQGVIRLNPYFSIQRKGGNGQRVRLPKDDLAHGGNNVQVKLQTGLLFDVVEPLCTLNKVGSS